MRARPITIRVLVLNDPPARLRTIVAKLGGISFSIGAGLIAGKEGPFVHGGGLVGGG